MKKFYVKHHEGFVSLYFLGFLLYFSTLTAVVVQNDIHRSETMINLQEDSQLFQKEREIILQFKCLLSSNDFDVENISTAIPGLEFNDHTAYYLLEGEQPEWIQIDYNIETREIINYYCILEP